MPKRYGNIYSKVITLDNLEEAHKCAKKDKSFYTAVQKTDAHLQERMQEIQDMLIDHTYKVGQYKTSIIYDKHKKRILYKLPYYPDRIIQWAFMLQIEPVFQEVFSNFTCASLPGRGVHYASNLLNSCLNNDIAGTTYCLKLDIKKFYPSIDHKILKKLLRKKFKDQDLLFELDKIIDSISNSNINKLNLSQEEQQIYCQQGKGLPTGSYLSQYFANYYLAFFDHWLKEELHCKYTIRYMDDIIILSDSKKFLHEVLNKIINYLNNNLKLSVKSNYQIFPVDARGIDFVGYRHFRGYKLLRKSTYKNAKKKAKNIILLKMQMTNKDWSAAVSYLGILSWADCRNFYNIYYRPILPYLITFYQLYCMGKYKSWSKYNNFYLPYESFSYKNKKYYINFNHKILHKRSF